MTLSLPGNASLAFKTRMRETRISLNMSQDELAQKVGSTKQVISTYETGARIPKVPMAVSIASALEKSLDWMCGFDTNEERPATSNGDGHDRSTEELIHLFHLVPKNQQDMVLGMIEAALKSQGLL